MGTGSAVRQKRRRFHQGESVTSRIYPTEVVKRCDREASETVKVCGTYEIRKTEDGEYELLKGGESVGWFSVAVVEDDRVLFPLSKGIQLEVSEGGHKEILTSEKAELCGLIGSDGGLYSTRTHPDHEVHFISKDRELVERYNELFKKVYDIDPHLHFKKKSKGRSYFESRTYVRGVYFDLWHLGIKPEAFKFRVPLGHLDRDGMSAYLRGFFSGDGNISKDSNQFKIRVLSICKEGLIELREAFEFLGFHPKEICAVKRKTPSHDQYYFTIRVDEHIRFKDEIGTYHPSRLRRLEEIERRHKMGEEE